MTGNLFFRKDKSVSVDLVHGFELEVVKRKSEVGSAKLEIGYWKLFIRYLSLVIGHWFLFYSCIS